MLDLDVCINCRYGGTVMGRNGAPEPELIHCSICGHVVTFTDEIPIDCAESLRQAISAGVQFGEKL